MSYIMECLVVLRHVGNAADMKTHAHAAPATSAHHGITSHKNQTVNDGVAHSNI